MKTQPSFVLERDWTSFNVENFIEFFERLKLESTEPCDRILLVLNRVNHRHVDRLMHKIHKSGRSPPTAAELSPTVPSLKAECHRLIEVVSHRPGAAKLLLGVRNQLLLFSEYKANRPQSLIRKKP